MSTLDSLKNLLTMIRTYFPDRPRLLISLMTGNYDGIREDLANGKISPKDQELIMVALTVKNDDDHGPDINNNVRDSYALMKEVSAAYPKDRKPLMALLAVASADLPEAMDILAPHFPEEEGRLYIACESGGFRCARRLLPNMDSATVNRVFMELSEKGATEAVTFLLKQETVDPNQQDALALRRALHQNNDALVQALLPATDLTLAIKTAAHLQAWEDIDVLGYYLTPEQRQTMVHEFGADHLPRTAQSLESAKVIQTAPRPRLRR